MNCRIDIDKEGNLQVTGENASLFYEASLLYGNDVDALAIYNVSLTDDFKNTRVEASVDNIIRFIENNNIEKASFFTQEDLSDIYNIPVEELSNFLSATTVDGEFRLDRENILSFYSP